MLNELIEVQRWAVKVVCDIILYDNKLEVSKKIIFDFT